MTFPKPSEAFASLEVRTLSRMGVDVGVLAMRFPDKRHAQLIKEFGLESIEIDNATPGNLVFGMLAAIRHPFVTMRLMAFIFRRTWRSPRYLLLSLAFLPSVMRCFERIKTALPDVVHLFWGHFPSLVGYLVQRYLPAVVVSHFLGAYDLLEYRYEPSAVVAKHADVVWTHARANLPAIEELDVPGARVKVVYRGIDTAAASADGRYGNSRRILSSGRLVRNKAFDEVLEIFARLRGSIPDAMLTIAGEGPERAGLEMLAKKHGINDFVMFTGHVPQETIFSYYDEADVLLLMSFSPSERLPNVIKEAALRRCVPVVSQTPGIEELITDGVDGFIVPLHDVDAAAERVREILKDPQRASVIADAARNKVISKFDVHTSMREYINIWEQLCDARSPARAKQ